MSVTEDPENSRFVGDGEHAGAELLYRSSGGRLEITRTFTPPELRGRGIAGQLVSAAVDRAREKGETLVPTCSYARQWIQQNPDAVVGLTIA